MNKLLIISLIIIAVGGIGLAGFSYASSNKPKADEPKKEVPITKPIENDKKEPELKKDFYLLKKNGSVMYKIPDGSYKTMMEDEIGLPYDSFVKTSDMSEAHVVFSNNSVVTVAPNSELQVKNENNNTEINQIIGRTWHRIQKLKAGESYSVKTDTAIAAVRGTTFDVEVKGAGQSQQAEISLLEGQIECKQLMNENGKKIEKVTKMVKANTTVNISDFNVNKGWNIRPIPAAKKSDSWYKENQEIDKMMDKGGPNAVKDVKEMLKDKFIDKVKGISTVRDEETSTNNNVTNTNTNKPVTTDKKKDNRKPEKDKEKPKISFKDISRNELVRLGISFKLKLTDNSELDNAEIKINGRTVKQCSINGITDECPYSLTASDLTSLALMRVPTIRGEVSDKEGNENSEEIIITLQSQQSVPSRTEIPSNTQPQTSTEPTRNLPQVFFLNQDDTTKESIGRLDNLVAVHVSGANTDVKLNIALSSNSSATNGEDFNLSSISDAVVPAGNNNYYIPIDIIDDEIPENTEEIVLQIFDSSDYNLGPKTTYTLKIEDNDTATNIL